MLKNPLIGRYRASLLRPTQIWIHITIYSVLVGILLFINASLFREGQAYPNLASLCRGLYFQFLAIEVLMLWFWTSYNAGTVIREEILQKTHDWFRLLPLSAHQKATGILVGRNLVALLLSGANTLALIVFGASSDLSFRLQAQFIMMLASGALLFNTLSVLTSTRRGKVKDKKKQGAAGVAGLLVAAVFIMNMVIQALVMSSDAETLEDFTIKFYSLSFPVIVISSLVAVYLAVWSYIGIIRRFTKENEPTFSNIGAVIFVIGYELILLGFFQPYFANGSLGLNCGFWASSFFILLLVPLGCTRSINDYLEHIGLSGRPSMTNLLKYTNPVLYLKLFVIWAAFAILSTVSCGLDLLYFSFMVVVTASIFVFLMSLLELSVVYSPSFNKLPFLLGFVTILFMFLPIILGGVLDCEWLYVHSPFGFFALVGDLESEGSPFGVLIVNIALSVLPILLIGKQYNRLIELRRHMTE